MAYKGWSTAIDELASDDWYGYEDFIRLVRRRLLHLSFTYDRESIRSKLNFLNSLDLEIITQPFRPDRRFPKDVLLINTSFEVEACLRGMLSATDIPDIKDMDKFSPEAANIYNKSTHTLIH